MQCTAKATAVAVAAGGTAVAHSVVGHYSVILYELDKYTAHTHSVRGREGGREIPSKTWWVVGPISFNAAQQKGERERERERGRKGGGMGCNLVPATIRFAIHFE